MFLILLIVSLALLLVVSYFILFSKEIGTPALSFTLGLFVCSVLLSINIEKWDIEIHEETYWLVFGGCVSLTIGSWVYKQCKRERAQKKDYVFRPISVARFTMLLYLQLVFAFFRVYFLFKYYGMGSLAENLVAHTMAIKFEGDSMKLPYGVGYIIGQTYKMAFVFAFLLPFYIERRKKYKKQYILCLLNFIITLLISLLSSGRSGMLWMLIAFGTFYFIQVQRKEGSLKFKRIAQWGIIAYIFLMGFQLMGTMIGREYSEEDAIADTIIEYCGAQIQNLDDFVSWKEVKTELWGEITFNSYYQYIDKNTGLLNLKDRTDETLPFNERAGHSLGNVYTALQSYYIDFGYMGVFVLCFFIGIVIESLFLFVIRGHSLDTAYLTWQTFLFANILPSMFMSFFSEAFCNAVTQIGTHNFWVSYILMCLLFYGTFPWKKRVDLLQLNGK